MRPRLWTCFLAFLIFVSILQWRAGAFTAEFDGYDESAHFVTGLMIHDYVTSGARVSPLRFAENYYLHYPKVAFGIWPPLFHITEGTWMLLFSPSRFSVLILMAIWAAGLATGCYLVVRPQFGTIPAFCLAILLLTLPEIQTAANMVMADLMMSCGIFLATLWYAKYLETGRTRDALLFGILSATAILVKYNAAALVCLPPIALLLSGRFDMMKRRSFWVPVPVVAAICGPWYILDRNMVRYAMDPVPGFSDIPAAAWENLVTLVRLTGVPLFAIAVVGTGSVWQRVRSRSAGSGIWIVALSLPVAMWFFHSILFPISETRYFLVDAPPVLLLAAAGCEQIASWLRARCRIRRLSTAAMVLSSCLVYAVVTYRPAARVHYGITKIASELVRRADRGQMVLVSGGSDLEGMLVSEMALLDRLQAHSVLRASKVLAHSTWMGANYGLVYSTTAQIADFLRDAPVSTIVFDRQQGYDLPHHMMLEQAIISQPELWVPMQIGTCDRVRVFQRVGKTPSAPDVPISIDMGTTLGRKLELHTWDHISTRTVR